MAAVSFEENNPYFTMLKQFLECPRNHFELKIAQGQIEENRQGYKAAYLALRAIYRIMCDHEDLTGDTQPTLQVLEQHLEKLDWLLKEPINLVEELSFPVPARTERDPWQTVTLRSVARCHSHS